MTMIPAVCQACGTIFSSGISIAGGAQATIIGCKSGPCPKCGDMGDIVDGVYGLKDKAFSFFKDNNFSIEDLKSIYTKLSNLDSEGISKEVIANKVPEISQLIMQFGGTGSEQSIWNSNSIITLFLAIINLAIMLNLGYFHKPPSSEGEKIIIEQLIELNNQKKAKIFRQEPYKNKKIRPNEICPLCPSGRKYKKCCGSWEKRQMEDI